MSTASTTPGIAQPLARYAALAAGGRSWCSCRAMIAVDPGANRIVRGYADIPD